MYLEVHDSGGFVEQGPQVGAEGCWLEVGGLEPGESLVPLGGVSMTVTGCDGGEVGVRSCGCGRGGRLCTGLAMLAVGMRTDINCFRQVTGSA